MFVDPRGTKQFNATEIKSAFSGSGFGFLDYLSQGSEFDLFAWQTINLYKQAMPFYHAVDIRAQAFADIPIRVWDKKSKEFVDDHDSLALFEKPNADTTQSEFLYQLASFFDITGNSFLLATGRVKKPPIELLTISPVKITFSFGNRFGFLNVPDDIFVTQTSTGQQKFRANETIDSDTIRFIKPTTEDLEIWHVRQFNPLRSSANFWGMSRAQSLFLELEQYIAGNRNNLSILKRGTRLSMAWTNTTGVELTETQWQRMQEEKQKYEGDRNAGGTPILDGMGVENIQQSSRDMQYKDLQEAMLERIAMTYNIPLAILTKTAMTLNNLETSNLQLYDNAVIPLTNYLYAELTRFLMPRYKNSEDLEFKFNENDIPALKVRTIENSKRLNEIGVNTIDEIRTLLGYEGLASGGDVILKPANLIAVGEDAFTDDELSKPTSNKFIRLMQDAKNKDGTPRYTDDQIREIIAKKDLF